MLDIFRGRKEIALPTNRLLEIGFYLFNIGAALLILKSGAIETTQEMVEVLSHKIGGFSINSSINVVNQLPLLFSLLFCFQDSARR